MSKQQWRARLTAAAEVTGGCIKKSAQWLASKHTGIGILVACAMSEQLTIVTHEILKDVQSIDTFVRGGWCFDAVVLSMLVVAICFRQISVAAGPLTSLLIALTATAVTASAVHLSIVAAVSPIQTLLFSSVTIALVAAAIKFQQDKGEAPAGLASLIADLRNRARTQRRQALAILCAIALAIGFGIWVFVRAESFGQLSGIERSVKYLESNLRFDLDGESKMLADINERLNRLSTTLGKEEVDKYTSGLRETQLGLEARLGAKEARANSLISELDALKGSAAFQPESRFEVYLISTLSTRIGIILLLVFFVQILVSLYRYSAKLGGVYDMHADALRARLYMSEATLDQLTTFFASQVVEFGTAPKAPSETLHQTLKDALSAIRQEAPKKE